MNVLPMTSIETTRDVIYTGVMGIKTAYLVTLTLTSIQEFLAPQDVSLILFYFMIDLFMLYDVYTV